MAATTTHSHGRCQDRREAQSDKHEGLERFAHRTDLKARAHGVLCESNLCICPCILEFTGDVGWLA